MVLEIKKEKVERPRVERYRKVGVERVERYRVDTAVGNANLSTKEGGDWREHRDKKY